MESGWKSGRTHTPHPRKGLFSGGISLVLSKGAAAMEEREILFRRRFSLGSVFSQSCIRVKGARKGISDERGWGKGEKRREKRQGKKKEKLLVQEIPRKSNLVV